VQVPYALELRLEEALVSRKGGKREVTSEESETTKLGADPSITLRTDQAETAYESYLVE
jgi:hypothetical protein